MLGGGHQKVTGSDCPQNAEAPPLYIYRPFPLSPFTRDTAVSARRLSCAAPSAPMPFVFRSTESRTFGLLTGAGQTTTPLPADCAPARTWSSSVPAAGCPTTLQPAA